MRETGEAPLIRSKATTTVKGQENVERIQEQVRLTKGSYVMIGFYKEAGKYTEGKDPPDVVEVALWNEFGTKKSPERSFIRSAIDENMAQINAWRDELLSEIMMGTLTAQAALETVGFRIMVMIQNKIKSDVPPPLADSTVAHKREQGLAPVTLIETGLMLRSVTYRIHMVGGAKIGGSKILASAAPENFQIERFAK